MDDSFLVLVYEQRGLRLRGFSTGEYMGDLSDLFECEIMHFDALVGLIEDHWSITAGNDRHALLGLQSRHLRVNCADIAHLSSPDRAESIFRDT